MSGIPVRTPSVRWLQVLLGGLLLLYFHLHFFASATRRYKDCSVAWVSVEHEAQSRQQQQPQQQQEQGQGQRQQQGQGQEQGQQGRERGQVQSGRKELMERRRVHAASGGGGSSTSGAGDATAGRKLDIVLVSMSSGTSATSTGSPLGEAGAKADASLRLRESPLLQSGRDASVMNARAAQFSGLLDITGPNKQQYAALHGYRYVDASDLLDRSRPASWSKILAVLSVLDSCDWVFWVDADTLITNMSTPLERLLPAGPAWAAAASAATAAGADAADMADAVATRYGLGLGGPDLILTADSTGVNAGVWLIRGRGCAWCRSFLARWWSMESFIRHDPHDSKSGDNDALKHMVDNMDSSELGAHVGIAPQCAFNSYLWRPSLRNWLRYLYNPRHILTGLWQPGDFLLHPAGVHHKKDVLLRFLRVQQQHTRPALSGAFTSVMQAAAGSVSRGSFDAGGGINSNSAVGGSGGNQNVLRF